MLVKNFHDLPKELQCEAVRPYFELLNQKRGSLLCKSIFDRLMAAGMLIILSPVFLVLAIMIKRDSEGEVFFRQTRVTQYGRTFGIYKFRTMVKNAESLGAQVTSQNDMRVTKVGNMLRSCRLDELPQLWNVFKGDMAFIGPRPERKFYIDQIIEHDSRYQFLYQIRPGVTSYATLYNGYTDTMEKMLRRLELDLYYLEHRSWWFDAKILVKTFINIIFGKKF